MGVRDPAALRRAVDLGIAMQLTNICRDVAEDEGRARVYLPRELLGTSALPTTEPQRSAHAVAALLRLADDFYRSGDEGLAELPTRCAVAIRAARLIYAEIGTVIARRGCDVRAGRAVVSRRRKLWLLGRATMGTLARTLVRTASRAMVPVRVRAGLRRRFRPASGTPPLPFSLPLTNLPGPVSS
jgi:phytoene synthase